MKIVVLGASGMLGSMLVKHLSKRFDVYATFRDKAKVVPIPRVEYYGYSADFDYLDLLFCEMGKDIRCVINAIGAIPQRTDDFDVANKYLPKWLNTYVQSLDIVVIQPTTDCVFSGEESLRYQNGTIKGISIKRSIGYTEKDEHNPVDEYGLSKSQGEVRGDKVYHFRCSLVGPESHSKSLLGWFLSQPKGASINGYTNHFWNGVTTLAFAKVCQGIIENNIKMPNVQHLVPADSVSKYELLCLFRKYFNRPDINIKPVDVEPINRTLSTVNKELNKRLWAEAGYKDIPTIEQMVKELSEYT